MKKMSTSEMRSVNGGASWKVKCPYCGKMVKSSLFQVLFWSNARVQADLMAMHGLNQMYGRKVGH